MTMQRLCHSRTPTLIAASLSIAAWLWPEAAAPGDAPAYNYPTQARVEYVNECIANHGDSLSSLYQCSCVIDRLADRLSYDDFVEASTYAKYSGLPGEGGAIFRDSDHARQLAKLYRELEGEANAACGVKKP